MSVTVLDSEHFNKAVRSFETSAERLGRSLENFGTGSFEQSVERFAQSVDKLGRLLGMQAENDQRKVIGASMMYDEVAFLNV